MQVSNLFEIEYYAMVFTQFSESKLKALVICFCVCLPRCAEGYVGDTCDESEDSKNLKLILAIAIPCVAGFAALIIIVCCVIMYRKKNRKE